MLASLRKTIVEKPAVGGGIAGAVLLLALAIFFLISGEENTKRIVTDVWYYDLNTKELFAVEIGDRREIPPHDAPSGVLQNTQGPMQAGGPAGVLAHQYACGSCSEERFIGYLETNTAELRALITSEDVLASAQPNAVALKNNGLLFRSPDDETWHISTTKEAQKIIGSPAKKCGAKKAIECFAND